jgi:hypothetical protein
MNAVDVKLALAVLSVSAALGCAGLTTRSDPRPVGTTGTVSEPQSVPATADRNQVPVGQHLDVRLQTPLSSETANVEDRFQATTAVDLLQGDRVLVPAARLSGELSGPSIERRVSTVPAASRSVSITTPA